MKLTDKEIAEVSAVIDEYLDDVPEPWLSGVCPAEPEKD